MDADSVQNIAINDIGQEYEWVLVSCAETFRPVIELTVCSPLTLLRSRTLFGRPSFNQIFSSLTQSIESGQYLPGREATLKTRLGVYFCGVSHLSPPSPLGDQLNRDLSPVRWRGWSKLKRRNAFQRASISSFTKSTFETCTEYKR